MWGEWHQNVTPQRSRSPAPARLVYGARALQSVSGTINRACWGWRARALRRYILVPLPPHVYPTSTSRDVSDQAFHAHNCPHAQRTRLAYNERLAGRPGNEATTWPLHGEAHDTHCSRAFCGVSRSVCM